MSLISEQIQKLRDLADDPEIDMYGIKELNDVFKEAADTIEILSFKLASENIERSSAYYNNGWISVEERLPDKFEDVLIWYKGRIDGGTCDGEEIEHYGIGYWTGKGWTISAYKNIKGEKCAIAWMPLPKEPYKE